MVSPQRALRLATYVRIDMLGDALPANATVWPEGLVRRPAMQVDERRRRIGDSQPGST
jgi:hypothetical protein